jgi:POT family proton-dependent oligopeptide transporter
MPILCLIAFLEFFERFGFYSMQGVLVLFLIKIKHFSSEEAYHTFGAFSALLFGFVGLGGYCSDRYLGPKKTMLLGLWIMFGGYLGLSFSPNHGFYPAIAAICIGNALFKANPASILGHIYQNKQSQLHAAFTIFYMAVNFGALFALLIGPFLSSSFGYQYAFGASACGIFIAICSVYYQHHILDIKNTKSTLPKIQISGLILGFFLILGFWLLTIFLLSSYPWVIRGLKILISFVLALYLLATFKERGLVRRKMLVVLILMFEAVVFFTLYQQMPTSLNMYAILHIHPTILGFHFDPQSFQALNPFWIILFSPLLAYLYQKNSFSENPWSIFQKFAMGMLCCGISYLILFVSHYFADNQFYISQAWLVFSYVFQAIAELLVSALGLAMVAELVPYKHMGSVMGMWFLTSAVSGFTGAKIASLTSVPQTAVSNEASLMGFAYIFGWIAITTIVISIIMFLLAPILRKLTTS